MTKEAATIEPSPLFFSEKLRFDERREKTIKILSFFTSKLLLDKNSKTGAIIL